MTTFLFTTSGAALSRVIRAVSGGTVSHVGIGKTLAGVRVVADASLLGIEMTERQRWLAGKEVVAELAVPDDFAPTDAYVFDKLGLGYDYSGMFGYFPVYVARWLGRRIRNPWASPTRLVCSEFVVRGVCARDHKWWGVLDAEFCDPSRLMHFCLTAGFARVA